MSMQDAISATGAMLPPGDPDLIDMRLKYASSLMESHAAYDAASMQYLLAGDIR